LIDTQKQETLEDASWKYNPLKKLDGEFLRHAFKEGAKWQKEKMFELVEEYNQMLVDHNVHEDHKEKSFKEWFEQFKNR
jgi:TRAP-type C4-dicarboxylate transport system substrate-binding protein